MTEEGNSVKDCGDLKTTAASTAVKLKMFGSAVKLMNRRRRSLDEKVTPKITLTKQILCRGGRTCWKHLSSASCIRHSLQGFFPQPAGSQTALKALKGTKSFSSLVTNTNTGKHPAGKLVVAASPWQQQRACSELKTFSASL